MAASAEALQRLEARLMETEARLAVALSGQKVEREKSLVDTRGIGKPSNFSGDVDNQGKMSEPIWQQWSFTFRAFVAAVSPKARLMIEETAKKAETDEVMDNAAMTEEERELSCQFFYLLATLCRGRALAVVQRGG